MLAQVPSIDSAKVSSGDITFAMKINASKVILLPDTISPIRASMLVLSTHFEYDFAL
jgi:hypothetical protein